MSEKWIEGYEGKYKITTEGKIYAYSKNTKKEKKVYKPKNANYYVCSLYMVNYIITIVTYYVNI
jgi:hypothetical protein